MALVSKLKVPELQGLIAKMGAKPAGGKADLLAHAERLLAGRGTQLLALPAPAPAAEPHPQPAPLALMQYRLEPG